MATRPGSTYFVSQPDDEHVRLRVPRRLAELLDQLGSSRPHNPSRNATAIEELVYALREHGLEAELVKRGLLPDPTLPTMELEDLMAS